MACLVAICIAGLVVVYNYHPILISYMWGTARDLGEPAKATVYTDGEQTRDIKVFREKTNWDGQKYNGYVLMLKQFDKEGMLQFVSVDLSDTVVGRPVSINKDGYDVINDHLYQSEVAYHLVDFRDDMKGFHFDPHLAFTNKEIKFSFPPGWLKFNSIRIVFN